MATLGTRIDNGEHLTEEDFDAHVAEWEKGPQDRPVSEHLGLTYDEFMYVCLEPDFPTAVKNIRLSRNTETT